jgi:DNA polymerase-3 subunit alpha
MQGLGDGVKFVSLHHHSTYSFMDGFGQPVTHINRSAELGMSAQALTEHGNVSSHPSLEKAANAAGIKPIFGLEAYTELKPRSPKKFHLTILAMNLTGYRNLMEIVTRSWAEGFYRWPSVRGDMLREHNEGLIVLSGCSDSALACALLGGKSIPPEKASYERAVRQANLFKEFLGDRFYLECQMFPELPRTHLINMAYERMSAELGIPLVGTADVHYPYPDDNEMQVILHAAGRGNNSAATQVESWEYDIRLTHPVSDAQVLERLRGTRLSKAAAGRALAATAEIADRCSVVLPKAELLQYPIAEEFPGKTASEVMWDWLRHGWHYRKSQGNEFLDKRKDEYVARLKHEMKLIEGKDFLDYFLVTSDVVRFAKNQHIPVGPARGSAAASLVCYLLRITEIDPMQYPLMYFERFIAPDREDTPDIDLDFDDERRSEVREYLVRKYGEHRVGNIGTFTKYKGKNSIDDVARVYRIPAYVAKVPKDMIIERSGGDSRQDAALMDTVKAFPKAKEVFDANPDLYKAIRLEGNLRGMSTHAAGIVVSNTAMSDVCAMYTRENARGELLTAVSANKKDAEYLGLLKMDFLGLATMGMLRYALDYAGMTLEELYRVPVTDQETIDAFRRNDVVGIFQFEGRATRLVNREVKPDLFLELSDINGLSRPGPLFSGTTAEYIRVKHGQVNATRFHPIIDAITAPTKGQVIYQEQVLKALSDFGGLSVKRVHEIRRIISLKLGEAQFNTSSQEFIETAVAMHGVTPETATAVWGRLVTSASYSFNIAHCISYAMLAFWCMYMKVHYPTAFYAAQLRKVSDDKWGRLIKDAEKHGVKINGVTPGVSEIQWRPTDDGEVVAGWQQLVGVGNAKARDIINYHDSEVAAGNPGIKSARDLINVKNIGAKGIEKFAQQIDSDDPFGLLKIKHSLDTIREAIDEGEIPLRRPTHKSDDLLDVVGGKTIRGVFMVKLIEYKDAIEDERARSGREIEDIKKTMEQPDKVTSATLHCYDDGDEDVYVRVHRMAFPRFKEALESITLNHDVIYTMARKSKGGFGSSVYVKTLHVIDPDDDE